MARSWRTEKIRGRSRNKVGCAQSGTAWDTPLAFEKEVNEKFAKTA